MCDPTTISLSWIREPFNSISHIIGALIFAALAIRLIRRGRGDWLRTVSLGVMAYASIQTLLISSAYHSLWPGAYRDLMLRADVVGIFILIAGSITPVHVILFTGVERWAPLALAWTIAIGGAFLRVSYFDSLPSIVGVAIFLAFGWATAVTAAVLWRRFGWRFVRFAVMSGLAYTVGAIVLVQHGPTVVKGVVGPHELWHLAVLTGLAMHWAFVYQFANGLAPRQRGLLIPLDDGPLVSVPLDDLVIPMTNDESSPLRHSA